MPSDASWPLQEAVYAALGAAAGVTALVGARVYDEPPAEQSAFPYITIGDDDAEEMGTKTTDIAEHNLQVHCWSRYNGRKEAKQINSAVKDALHHNLLSVTGHAVVELHWVSSFVILDADGETWHGVSRYRAIVEDT